MTGNKKQECVSNSNTNSNRKIEFLSIGHFTHDIVGDKLILGGASAYSSVTAKKMGLYVGVITSVGSDFLHYDKLDDISLRVIDSVISGENHPTTTFQNIYENGVRKQFIRGVSARICHNNIPDDWCNPNIVYLCPVANEIESLVVNKFPNSIIGVSPQGWMRRWDSEGRVYAQKWEDAAKVLPYIDILVMSEEDIAPFPEVIDEYANMTKIMILTRGERGSTLYNEGRITNFRAFKTNVIDPTGAGDVFATAFLIKYQQTRDPYESSIFANCVASFVVEEKGMGGIPDFDHINQRLAIYSHQK